MKWQPSGPSNLLDQLCMSGILSDYREVFDVVEGSKTLTMLSAQIRVARASPHERSPRYASK